jgi:hypothetical protein
MRPRAWGALCCLGVLAGLPGCLGGPPTHFYVLTPLPASDTPTAAAPGPPLALGLYPVTLPAVLDRPQIVTRIGDNGIGLAEFDQWGAPLTAQVTAVLAQNLSRLLPTARVAVFPWTGTGPPDLVLTVAVLQWDAVLGQACVLTARWTLVGAGGKEPKATGLATHREATGDTYATLAAAESRLVAALGQDIATGITALPR